MGKISKNWELVSFLEILYGQAYQILKEGHWLLKRKNMGEVLQVMLK